MIARIWHGKVKAEDFESYTTFMKRQAIPDYQQTKGFVKRGRSWPFYLDYLLGKPEGDQEFCRK